MRFSWLKCSIHKLKINTQIENRLFPLCGIQNNALQIAVSVALCAVIAIALHELVEKPCARMLKKKL